METRTYGVEGYMDWQCEIPVGKARASVHFTGGTMTAYGVTPAEYSTSDPVKQRIIEGSTHFRNGRIKLLRKSGKPEARRMHAGGKATAVTPSTDPLTHEASTADKSANAAEKAPATDPLTHEEHTEADGIDAETGIEPEEVAVSCLTEAQNYLRDHYGIATSRSRSKEKAQAFARENGIIFTGLE